MAEKNDTLKMIGLSVLALLVITGLGWFFAGNDLAMMKVFSPAKESVRRETFENSKAYRDGTIQELRAMQFEYLKADESRRPGLANVIRHKAAGFPEDAMPGDLLIFINSLSIEESP